MNELISCVITTYNRKSTIKRAIDSVLNQTYKNIELIIVDDASTDGTLEYVSDLYGEDDRIIYILNKYNEGVSEARNIGIRASSGRWVAIQDSDDEWRPEKLEKQVALIDDNDPEIGLIYCQWKVIMQDGRSFEFPEKEIPLDFKSGKIFIPLLHSTLVSTQTLLFRRDYYDEVGGFDSSFKAAVDWEFCTRMAYKYKLLLCDEVLVNVYESLESVSKDRRETLKTYCRVYNRYFPLLRAAGYYDQSIKFLWKFAGYNKNGINYIEDFYDIICIDDRSKQIFEELEIKRRNSFFDTAEVKVAFFVDDCLFNHSENVRRPELLKPFFYMCDSQKHKIDIVYNLLMLIRLLSQRDNGIFVTVFHTNGDIAYPWEVNSIKSDKNMFEKSKEYDLLISDYSINDTSELKISVHDRSLTLPVTEDIKESNIYEYEELMYIIKQKYIK